MDEIFFFPVVDSLKFETVEDLKLVVGLITPDNGLVSLITSRLRVIKGPDFLLNGVPAYCYIGRDAPIAYVF